RTGASGLRSSWARIAMNSSLRRSPAARKILGAALREVELVSVGEDRQADHEQLGRARRAYANSLPGRLARRAVKPDLLRVAAHGAVEHEKEARARPRRRLVEGARLEANGTEIQPALGEGAEELRSHSR